MVVLSNAAFEESDTTSSRTSSPTASLFDAGVTSVSLGEVEDRLCGSVVLRQFDGLDVVDGKPTRSCSSLSSVANRSIRSSKERMFSTSAYWNE